MQTEMSNCDTFTVAVGIIRLFTTKKDEINEDNEDDAIMVSELTKYVLETFDSLQCYYLNQLYIENYDN